MKKAKKVLSLVLAVLMFVSVVPIAYAESNKVYQVGDIVQFGTYPQREVKDEALIAELNAIAPEWDDWISYEYYSQSVSGDWMRYIDKVYNGNKYRGVKFTHYRPDCTYKLHSETNQYDNGYCANTVYWFKFEPIYWRVLDPNESFVVCETIIDSQPYTNTSYHNDDMEYRFSCFNDQSYTNYANDYETSSIRKWLNDNFYNTSFTDSEKEEIAITTINNDAYEKTFDVPSGYKDFDSNETNDKIFLLSYHEVTNSEYGLSLEDGSLCAQGSDYAKSQGLRVYNNEYTNSGDIYGENSCWSLRSPDNYYSDAYAYVYYSGYSLSVRGVCVAGFGARPALCFDDISKIERHEHSYKKVITAPTCIVKGYTTCTCDCGNSYAADYVEVVDHTDTNSDYKCDYGCGYEFDKPVTPTPDNSDCSCMCHKAGIMRIIWMILKFIYKIFGMNSTCVCGIAHY